MRKLTQILTPGLMAAALLLAPAMVSRVAAQDPAATPAATPAAATPVANPECDAMYKTFSDQWTAKNYKDGYESGKAYLAKCSDQDKTYVDYVKKAVDKWEGAILRDNFEKAVAKNTADAAPDVYNYGKQLLAKKPDDLSVIMALAHIGNAAYQAKNTTYKSDAIAYSKQAIQMIEGGTVPTRLDPVTKKDAPNWLPFTGKESALGFLYFGLGFDLQGEKNEAEAINYFYKASQVKSEIVTAYDLFYLAEAYNNVEVEKAHKAALVFDGQPPSPESDAATSHWYQLMDRAMDFYARALVAARAGTDAGSKSLADQSLEQLTIYYKIRHNNTDTGLNDFIANVTKNPMPAPSSPLPPLPPPTPAATTASGGNASTPAPGAASTGAKPPLGSGGTPTPTPAKESTPAPAAPPKPMGAKPPTKARQQKNHGAH